MADHSLVLGVDIGGTHLKAAPVDVTVGELRGDRIEIETPQPGTIEQLVNAAGELVDRHAWGGAPVGFAFPGVVDRGVVLTATNLDEVWVGVDLPAVMREALGREASAINDADAAGFAEVAFGAARGVGGVVVVVTLGTGVGTGLFVDGTLVPNAELGNLHMDGHALQEVVSGHVRDERGMSWEEWAGNVSKYLRALENLVWPSRIVLGGGISECFEDYAEHLETRTEVVPAELGNRAGIVGAALSYGLRLARSERRS